MQRDTPHSPLSTPLRLFSRSGPQPTARTVQLLRRYDLDEKLEKDSDRLTAELQRLIDQEPAAEKVYALAELAFIRGRELEEENKTSEALEVYGETVASSYTFLLDSQFDWERNPYDPQFRRACDLYNGALERVLRILKKRGELRPGHAYSVTKADHQYDIKVVMRGNWRAEDFGDFDNSNKHGELSMYSLHYW